MNNYRKLIFPLSVSVGFIILFFSDPSAMVEGVRNGLYLCGETVIPSLFPFMILSDFTVRSGLGNAVGKIFSPVTEKVFALPGCSACAIIMSLVGGFPVGAKMISQLFENNSVSAEQAKRMMRFCVNSGPAFVIGAVGATMLSSKKIGIILFVSQTVSSLIIGIASGIFSRKNNKSASAPHSPIDASVLTESVSCATEAMLNTCAWILLFSSVVSFLNRLAELHPVFNTAVLLSEVTSGCAFAARHLPVYLIAPVICWSGFAVHMQLLPYIKKIGISLPEFWLSRAVNSLLSLPVAFILFKIFPCESQVFSSFSDVVVKPYSVSVPASVAMLILGAFTIIDLKQPLMGKKRGL